MPLNLEPRTGDFTPFLKYNAVSGRWYIRNDTGEEVEVDNMVAIFDLAQIKTGWIMFSEGAPPDSVWDNGAMATQPSPKHRRGFAVNVFSPKTLGGLREYSSSSNVSIVSIKELYAAWEAEKDNHPGKVPVVEQSMKPQPVKSKFGTNYQPVLKIVRWADRPEALPLGVAAPGKSASSVPPPVIEVSQPDEAQEEF